MSPAATVCLGGGDLVERSADVHRGGRRRRRVAPRHRVGQRVVELEHGRSVAVPEIALARSVGRRSPAMAHEVARHDVGEDDGGGRQLVEAADRPPTLHLSPDGRAARRRARRRSPASHPRRAASPPRVRGRRRRARRRRWPAGRTARWRGRRRRRTGPARRWLDEVRSRQSGRRAQGGQPEASHHERMARERQRRQHVVDRSRSRRRRPVPSRLRPRLAVGTESGAGRLDRSLQQDGVVVERVGKRDRRLDPAQPVAIERQRAHRFGEATPRGWIAEQTSWTKPGSVSSALRVPPPGVAWPSTTSTRRPVRAIVMAATSPLGPEPMTTASYSDRRHAQSSGRRASVSCACSMSSTGASRRTSSSAPRCWPP